MSLRARVVLTVVLTVLTVGAMGAYVASSIADWHRIGMTGVVFFPDIPAEKRPPLEMFGPGRVFMTFATAPADRAGIRAGDRVVAVNGIPASDNRALEKQAAALKAGDRVTYRIRRGETLRDVSTRLVSPLRVPLFASSLAVSLIVGFAYLAIGFLVLAKRPDDRRVLVFFAMMAVGTLYLICMPVLSLESAAIRGLTGESSGKTMLPWVAMSAVFIAFLATSASAFAGSSSPASPAAAS